MYMWSVLSASNAQVFQGFMYANVDHLVWFDVCLLWRFVFTVTCIYVCVSKLFDAGFRAQNASVWKGDSKLVAKGIRARLGGLGNHRVRWCKFQATVWIPSSKMAESYVSFRRSTTHFYAIVCSRQEPRRVPSNLEHTFRWLFARDSSSGDLQAMWAKCAGDQLRLWQQHFSQTFHMHSSFPPSLFLFIHTPCELFCGLFSCLEEHDMNDIFS